MIHHSSLHDNVKESNKKKIHTFVTHSHFSLYLFIVSWNKWSNLSEDTRQANTVTPHKFAISLEMYQMSCSWGLIHSKCRIIINHADKCY